jgi:hypothetical protein
MLRVALGHHFAQLSYVANSSSKTSFKAIAEPFTSLPGACQVDGNTLFSNILAATVAIFGLCGVR